MNASSHMDAPLITLDPAANTTDVYAFVDEVDGEKNLVVALGVYPHQEPGIGPEPGVPGRRATVYGRSLPGQRGAHLESGAVAATSASLGETEASYAAEQLRKGYPSRAVTDLRRGGLRVSPTTSHYCPCMPQEPRTEGGTNSDVHRDWPASARWQEFPERAEGSRDEH